MSESCHILVIDAARFETATQALRRQNVGYNAVTSSSKLESFRMSTHQGAFTEPRLSTPLLLGIVLATNSTPDEFYYLGLVVVLRQQGKQDEAAVEFRAEAVNRKIIDEQMKVVGLNVVQ